MSTPGEVSVPVDAPAGDVEHSEQVNFKLVIVSPSTGVASPLTFPQLPIVTTVSQLKARIRDTLPSKPLNDSQRLIHRGRLLGRDTESMLEIFGQEAVSSPYAMFYE
jgi:hypothetical protein